MITFAFFMLLSVYCKINEYRAIFSLLQEDILTNSIEKKTVFTQLQKRYGEAWPIVAGHLDCFPAANKKLPVMVKSGCILSKTPFEQSTSEIIAEFHAELTGKAHILSITGGLGVNDIAFDRAGSEVLSLDPDACLNALCNYNFEKLNSGVQRITTTAEDFLANNHQQFDLLFADPDRRPEGNRVTSDANQYLPNIFELLRKHRSVAPRWLIKLSPMTDIFWLREAIHENMDVYVLSVGNEVKEILADVGKGADNRIVFREFLPGRSPLWMGEKLDYTNTDFEVFTEPKQGTIKCGFHRNFQSEYPMHALNSQHTYFQSKILLPEFAVRNFRLLKTIHGSIREMASELNKLGISAANISCREFVLSADELRKKLKIKDGGNSYLFFTGTDEKYCYVTEKI